MKPILQLAGIVLVLFTHSCAPDQSQKTSLPGTQVWVVVTPHWDSVQGVLYAFEKVQEGWMMEDFPVPIVTGKKGLAPAQGLFSLPAEGPDPKQEGDLRSPAGIFALGPVFGHAPTPPGAMPYVAIGPHTRCIEAGASVYYNQIIDDDTATVDWPKADLMLRPDSLYEYGVFVQQNMHPVEPGSGSCIFFHAWSKPGRGTAGCTALDKAILKNLVAGLDSAKQPVLVQVPRSVYQMLRQKLDLPGLI